MRPLSIVVVGGGTAGWITASLLQQKLGRNAVRPIDIKVVESRRIGILGVGEATLPTIKKLLRILGISEHEFIAETDATFKQGILYKDWREESQADQRSNSYFHPFDYSNVVTFNTTHWWLATRGHLPGVQYAEDLSAQARVAAAGRAPRHPGMPQFEAPLGYAYHLDAERFAEFLASMAMRAGVTRIYDEVLATNLDDDGLVSGIVTRENGSLEADFFVDCTGFARVIVEKGMGIGFIDYGRFLFCNRAVALRVPTEAATPIRPFTTATAKGAGWVWDIDLRSRRGTGYVYSSDHLSADDAEAELRRHVGPTAARHDARHLKMRVGRSEKFWHANVAAIGLSGGFIEPLESTGIFLIEAGAMQLVDSLQGILGLARQEASPGPGAEGRTAGRYRSALNRLSTQYNLNMTTLYEEILDFIKVHYQPSKRTDTPFWRDNTAAASSTPSLLEKLEAWSLRPPSTFDFRDRHAVFNEHNWLYVMLGMGWRPSSATGFRPFTTADAGDRLTQLIAENTANALSSLPVHRSYFEGAAVKTAAL